MNIRLSIPLTLISIAVIIISAGIFSGPVKAEPAREHSVVILLSEAYNGQAYVYTVSSAGPAPEIKSGDITARAIKSLLDAGFTQEGDWFSMKFVR